MEPMTAAQRAEIIALLAALAAEITDLGRRVDTAGVRLAAAVVPQSQPRALSAA